MRNEYQPRLDPEQNSQAEQGRGAIAQAAKQQQGHEQDANRIQHQCQPIDQAGFVLRCWWRWRLGGQSGAKPLPFAIDRYGNSLTRFPDDVFA
jgi:hypothetical protein